MEKHKLDYLKELLEKYDLFQNNQTGELKVNLKDKNKAVNLSNEKLNDLVFAYSWARAWVEAGMYQYDVPVEQREIPGFDENGKKLYDNLIQTMKDWSSHRGFHYFIDVYSISDKVAKKCGDVERASQIVFQLLRPDRLDYKDKFYELVETGKMTTELVNQDELLHKMYKYLMVEAEYKSEKGFQPGE